MLLRCQKRRAALHDLFLNLFLLCMNTDCTKTHQCKIMPLCLGKTYPGRDEELDFTIHPPYLLPFSSTSCILLSHTHTHTPHSSLLFVLFQELAAGDDWSKALATHLETPVAWEELIVFYFADSKPNKLFLIPAEMNSSIISKVHRKITENAVILRNSPNSHSLGFR